MTAKSPQDDRREQHRRALQSIAFHRGIEGVAEYKLEHPDAAAIRVNVNALAYAPKPKGYGGAITAIVKDWFRSDAALAAPNRADVERLNSQFGKGRFPVGSHFSKPLSPGLRHRIAKLFEGEGATLPEAAETMTAVRQAVRAFKAQALAGAMPFGGIGTRTDDTLTIAGQSYAISRNGKRECIRVRINGNVRRLYLDDVLAIASLLGAPGETPPITYYISNMGECDYFPETTSADPLQGVPAGDCDYSPGECDYLPSALPEVPGDCDYSTTGPPPDDGLTLTERIRRLAANRPQTLAPSTGRDPLELDGTE